MQKVGAGKGTELVQEFNTNMGVEPWSDSKFYCLSILHIITHEWAPCNDIIIGKSLLSAFMCQPAELYPVLETMAADSSRPEWGMVGPSSLLPVNHLLNIYSLQALGIHRKSNLFLLKQLWDLAQGRHTLVCKNDHEESHLFHNGQSPGTESC